MLETKMLMSKKIDLQVEVDFDFNRGHPVPSNGEIGVWILREAFIK